MSQIRLHTSWMYIKLKLIFWFLFLIFFFRPYPAFVFSLNARKRILMRHFKPSQRAGLFLNSGYLQQSCILFQHEPGKGHQRSRQNNYTNHHNIMQFRLLLLFLGQYKLLPAVYCFSMKECVDFQR